MIRYNAVCTPKRNGIQEPKIIYVPYVTTIVIEQTARTWLKITFPNFIRSNYRPVVMESNYQTFFSFPLQTRLMFFLVNFFFFFSKNVKRRHPEFQSGVAMSKFPGHFLRYESNRDIILIYPI